MLARSWLGILVPVAFGCRPETAPIVPKDFRSELPVIAIDSQAAIADEPKTQARMRIYQNSELVYDGLIGIELRGRSSLVYSPKKQFGFELLTEGGIETKGSLLGMPAESDWVLYGPYSDKSLLRNALTFELSRRMGRYAPRTIAVELFVRQGEMRPRSEEFLAGRLALALPCSRESMSAVAVPKTGPPACNPRPR